jgi:hypothetical protein
MDRKKAVYLAELAEEAERYAGPLVHIYSLPAREHS